MILRDYQSEAVNAAWQWLCTQAGNPVIVLPTGSGKSLVIAQLASDAVNRYGGRVLILQHRKELIRQNADKLRRMAPDLDIGIYSAGLKSRDTEADVVLAGIQSAYKHAFDFGQRNLVIIDENHLVPFDGEGIYRKFLADLRTANERLRVVGTTATPYRLDCGPVCRPDAIFQKVCYSASIQRLIADEYLSNLTTQPAENTADTSGLRLRGGEFIAAECEGLFNQHDRVEAACAEIVFATRDRRSVLVFCSGVAHARHVAETIERLTGEPCGVVTGDTMPLERDATLTAFAERQLRFLTNVDVLTTGFDAPCIDAIAILRATMSAGLYAQIVGRGFRVFPGKQDALVLDFGGNIARHGPIDAIDYGRCKRTGAQPGEAPVKVCPACEQEVFAGQRECECGFLFPEPRERHDSEADTQSQILAKPKTWLVENVSFGAHFKRKDPNAPPTMEVNYECVPDGAEGGNLKTIISEWVCIEHEGYARQKAVKWWKARSIAPVPNTVQEAVELAQAGALAWPRSITCIKEGRWWRVLSAVLDEKPEEWGLAEIEEEELPF